MEFIEEKEWFLLYELGRIGALEGTSKTATQIASLLSSSQQTISRRLKSLKEKGYITNVIQGSDILIKLTEKGKSTLLNVYQNLKDLFINSSKKLYCGYVQTGLGEGKFYVQLPEYNIQFLNILKKVPFPGTLNLKLDSTSLDDFYHQLSQEHFLTVHGFESNERTYGKVKCYSIKISKHGNEQDDFECLLVDIKRSSHEKGTIEIISSVNLRESLKLKDGSPICFSFAKL